MVLLARFPAARPVTYDFLLLVRSSTGAVGLDTNVRQSGRNVRKWISEVIQAHEASVHTVEAEGEVAVGDAPDDGGHSGHGGGLVGHGGEGGEGGEEHVAETVVVTDTTV